jgi:methylglutaconyl-CoA hydratase
MSDQLVLQKIDKGVGRLTLNRPEVHNAFDDALIAQLTAALLSLEADRRVRVVVLAAAGKSFSAGADLAWMQRMAGYSEAENLEDARALAGLMSTLDRLAKPTVALVTGSPSRPSRWCKVLPSAAGSGWLPAAISRSPRRPRVSVSPRSSWGSSPR